MLGFFDSLRPFLSRVVAPVVAAGTGWLAHKTGILVDDASATTALIVGVYGVVHKVLDKHFNPADTASSHLAAEGVATAADLKAQVR